MSAILNGIEAVAEAVAAAIAAHKSIKLIVAGNWSQPIFGVIAAAMEMAIATTGLMSFPPSFLGTYYVDYSLYSENHGLAVLRNTFIDGEVSWSWQVPFDEMPVVGDTVWILGAAVSKV